MVVSHNFEGFENVEKNAAFVLSALPAAAYDQLDKSMVPDALHKQGIDIDKREPISLNVGKGFILSGKQTSGNAHFKKWLLVAAAGDLTALVTVQIPDPGPDQEPSYSDKTVLDTLATLAVRASVPDAERLSLLPFTVGNLAGFHIDDVLPGRALMLFDPSTDQSKSAGNATPTIALNARFLIIAAQGGPAEASDRDNFARVAFDQISGIKEVRVQDAEPLRLGNQAGYQTLAKAKDAQSDADVMVVQWLRFGSGGFIQMIGIARAEIWLDVFSRMRAVRDSIDPK